MVGAVVLNHSNDYDIILSIQKNLKNFINSIFKKISNYKTEKLLNNIYELNDDIITIRAILKDLKVNDKNINSIDELTLFLEDMAEKIQLLQKNTSQNTFLYDALDELYKNTINLDFELSLKLSEADFENISNKNIFQEI